VQLATYASGDGTDVKPSIQTLADALGCNRRTIARRIIELRTLGFLEDGGLDGQFKTRIRSINVDKVITPVTDSTETPVTDSPITCDRFEGNLRQIHESPVTDRRSPVTDRRPNEGNRHIDRQFQPSSSTVIVDREPPEDFVVGEPCSPCSTTTDRSNGLADEGECPNCGDPCPAGQETCDECIQAENRRITIGAGNGYVCPSCSVLRGWSKWRDRKVLNSPRGTLRCPECDVAVVPREATPEEYGMALNGWTLEQLEEGEMIVKNEMFNQFFQIDEETEEFVPSELPEPKGKRHLFSSQTDVIKFYQNFRQWDTHELVLRLGPDGYAVDAEPSAGGEREEV